MPDQFFTPFDIARNLVSSLRMREEVFIADFAAGDGELLLAAERRWPDSEILATDLLAPTVQRLRRRYSRWDVGKCDFLSNASRERCPVLKSAKGRVTLAVLNPPFSCRGGRKHSVTLDDDLVTCGQALAFVFSAMPFLASSGRIAAILPVSSLSSQKDEFAWKLLRRHFKVNVQKAYESWTFPDCSARTVVVTFESLRKSTLTVDDAASTSHRKASIHVHAIRGATSIHAATNGLAGEEWPLVHTTNLKMNKIAGGLLGLKELRRHVSGPAVLLPRVGKPDSRKCVVYLRKQRLVLSDCVFALSCGSRAEAEELQRRIVASWDRVSPIAYAGTCAPYATLQSLERALAVVGCAFVK